MNPPEPARLTNVSVHLPHTLANSTTLITGALCKPRTPYNVDVAVVAGITSAHDEHDSNTASTTMAAAVTAVEMATGYYSTMMIAR